MVIDSLTCAGSTSIGDRVRPEGSAPSAPTDQLASARIAVATMASAAAGVNPPCPVAGRYTAALEDQIQRHLGVDVGVQFTAGDTAVPDLRHGCSAEVHLVRRRSGGTYGLSLAPPPSARHPAWGGGPTAVVTLGVRTCRREGRRGRRAETACLRTGGIERGEGRC
ncbi:MAG: hypothetical protein JWQ86_1074 [Mycobacterium sp.]|nr:hypothetical protein [Mycobacterium sp.]